NTACRIGSLRDPVAGSGKGTCTPWSEPSSNWQKHGPSVGSGTPFGHVPWKPATSIISVGGMCAWACSRCVMPCCLSSVYEKRSGANVNWEESSGKGKLKPCELSNGSPDSDWNRPFHINAG